MLLIIQDVTLFLKRIQTEVAPHCPPQFIETECSDHSQDMRGDYNLKMVMLNSPHHRSNRQLPTTLTPEVGHPLQNPVDQTGRHELKYERCQACVLEGTLKQTPRV